MITRIYTKNSVFEYDDENKRVRRVRSHNPYSMWHAKEDEWLPGTVTLPPLDTDLPATIVFEGDKYPTLYTSPVAFIVENFGTEAEVVLDW